MYVVAWSKISHIMTTLTKRFDPDFKIKVRRNKKNIIYAIYNNFRGGYFNGAKKNGLFFGAQQLPPFQTLTPFTMLSGKSL
jgi:hypothetical protein